MRHLIEKVGGRTAPAHDSRTGPAQLQPAAPAQTELAICDKTIERTHGWFNRFRRLSKDYESRTDNCEAWTWLVATRLLVTRVAKEAA